MNTKHRDDFIADKLEELFEGMSTQDIWEPVARYLKGQVEEDNDGQMVIYTDCYPKGKDT